MAGKHLDSQHVTSLSKQLEHQVRWRTGGRVRQLAVEVGPCEVVLRGRATSYHIKQLAQQGVLDLLPDVPLQNRITVELAAYRPLDASQ